MVGGGRLGDPAACGTSPGAAGPGGASGGRLHPGRSRVGASEVAPRRRAGPPAEWPGHRLQQPHAAGRHAGVRGRRRRGDPRRRDGTARGPRHLARAVAAPGLGRSPHRVRRRPPGPAAGRFAGSPADPARAPPGGARPRGRAGGWPGVLRRRPVRVRGGPPAQRADLAAAGGARPGGRLRVRRRGRHPARRRGIGRHRVAGGHLRRRLGHADEHLRAQPGDAARTGPGRRLLPVDDQPIPRGAGDPQRTARPRSPMPSGSPWRRPGGPSSSVP